MKTKFNFKASIIVVAMILLPSAHAALMSKADYTAGKSTIKAAYKTDKAACSSMSGNAKDICVEEAKAKEKVAKAELEFAHTGSVSDKNKITVAAAESAYAVAKEKCDDKSSNDKDVCVKEAKAIEAKALADVKMTKKVGAAVRDDVQTKLDVDYKTAIEKCDAMTGDAKTSCVNSAKAKFGKS